MRAITVNNKRFFWQQLALGLLSLGLIPGLAARPAIGARQIALPYGVIKQSVSLDAIETYTQTGHVNDELAAYTRYITPEQLTQLRQVLVTRVLLDAKQVSAFILTPTGEQLVRGLATLIESDGSQSSFLAIQVALKRATTTPEGLTLLNVLRQFPSDRLDLDLARSLKMVNTLKALVNDTNRAVVQIEQQAEIEASAMPLSSDLPLKKLQQQGSFAWEQHSLSLTDRSRQRTFPVELYLPRARSPHPVIVISHGLGGNRYNLTYLARHLASHGFAVAVPEHIGSNWKQVNAFFAGKANYITHPDMFVDRPRDVTYLLDELERRSRSDRRFQGRLNLQQVGVIGQSFGGYTALALAGAKPDFEQLKSDCQSWQNFLNLSLLFQCRALALPRRDYNLFDPRVKAVVAISPVGRSIFGRSGMSQIQMPILMVAGSADAIAPALPEQIQPFTWLTVADKYLALIEGGEHDSSIEKESNKIFDLPTAADPAIVRQYVCVLSTAFFGTYVANRSSYRAYLSAAYAKRIGQHPLQLSLVRSLPTPQLAQTPNRFDFSNYIVVAIVTGIGVRLVKLISSEARRDRSTFR